MFAGSLVRYWNIDEIPVTGLVLQDVGFMKLYGEDMVKVYWFDDHSTTDERVSELVDPACEQLEVISKIRSNP